MDKRGRSSNPDQVLEGTSHLISLIKKKLDAEEAI